MNLSHFLEIQGQFSHFISLFHYVISHWIRTLRHQQVYLQSLDQIELIPSARSHWKYHFYRLDVHDSFLFTLLPPFWKVNLHYSTLSPELIDSCPHLFQHHWISFLKDLQYHLQKTSVHQMTEPIRDSFSHLISQLLIDSSFQCLYCQSHEHWSSSSPCLFPKRILYQSSFHQEFQSSILTLVSTSQLHVRSPVLLFQMFSILYQQMFSAWKAWLQSVDQYSSIQRQCILDIQSLWIKEVPFFPLSSISFSTLFHHYFQLFTEIENWEVDHSFLQRVLSQTSFLLLLLFSETFSFQSKPHQSFSFNQSKVMNHQSLLSCNPFVHRCFDTHPLRLGEFFERNNDFVKDPLSFDIRKE